MLIKLKAATIGRSDEELDWRANTWRTQRSREFFRMTRSCGYQYVDVQGVGNIDENEVDVDWQFPLPLAEVQAQLRELNEQTTLFGERAVVNFFYGLPYGEGAQNEAEATDDEATDGEATDDVTDDVEATEDEDEGGDEEMTEEDSNGDAGPDANDAEEANASIHGEDQDANNEEEHAVTTEAEENADLPEDDQDTDIEEEDDSNGDDGSDDTYIPDEGDEESTDED
ncbi:hypothetical protein MMC07_002701 [Pseudocyphellaria aurata]|nr:hypothetical protein [Pseudocyphellaria aurata]